MIKKKKILLVDDDSIYLFVAQRTIKMQFPNTEILVCKNGQEALQQLSDCIPDVMLLDINMPVLNGWEVLEHLNKRHKKLSFPIFIVSSSIDERDIKKAESNKLVKGYIRKPIDQKELSKIDFQYETI